MERSLVLFSGGLDSRLVVKILQEQGLLINLLYFRLPFGCGCSDNLESIINFSKEAGAKLIVRDCTKGKLFQEYIKVIKNPKFGRGAGLNPCIDCKIFMFKKAAAYAKKKKIKIIATGEVLGERPMSQNLDAIKIIDKQVGFEILRPLSAKLLPQTKAEKEGLVDRKKFFAIQGRNRKIQMELARKFNISYPTPAGGCLLCDKNYSNRLKDFLECHKDKKIILEHLLVLRGFRHFRNPITKGKIILGRNERENLILEKLNKKLKYHILIPTTPGPTALYENKKDKKLAEQLIKAYSGNDLKERKRFEKIKV